MIWFFWLMVRLSTLIFKLDSSFWSFCNCSPGAFTGSRFSNGLYSSCFTLFICLQKFSMMAFILDSLGTALSFADLLTYLVCFCSATR